MTHRQIALTYATTGGVSMLALLGAVFVLGLPEGHWLVGVSGIACLAHIILGLPVFVAVQYARD